MLTEISHPSLNLVNNDSISNFTFPVSEECQNILSHLVQEFKKHFSSVDAAAKCYSIEDIKSIIITDKNAEMTQFSKKIVNALCEQSGYAYIKGFPVHFEQDDTAIALFILGCYLGDPSYNNRDKKYIWPVIPKQIPSSKNLVNNERHGNTPEPLPFHTDTSTFAGLLCIVPARIGGENLLISTVAIHNNIFRKNPEALKILYSNFYINRNGEELDNELPYTKIPVFGVSRTGQLKTFWGATYNYDAYEKYKVPPLSIEQQEAYRVFKESIDEIQAKEKTTIGMERGDLLFVNNNLILHNRLPFVSDDENERKLFRIWVYSQEYETFPHVYGYAYPS